MPESVHESGSRSRPLIEALGDQDMNISVKYKLLITLVVPIGVAGCKTEYDDFSKLVAEGIEEKIVRNYLDARKVNYSFHTCEEIEKQQNIPKLTCSKEGSLGAYQGVVNDGSYMLGMGSSDVFFQVEIGPKNTVVNIHLDEIYTFL